MSNYDDDEEEEEEKLDQNDDNYDDYNDDDDKQAGDEMFKPVPLVGEACTCPQHCHSPTLRQCRHTTRAMSVPWCLCQHGHLRSTVLCIGIHA